MLWLMERLARLMAIVGGLLLTALVVLIAVSVSGRGLNTLGHSDFLTSISESAASALLATGVGPVEGDYELVEAGVAFAIFSFLPICQLYGGHATVDLFTRALSENVNRMLITFWEVVLAGAIILLSWRLGAGMISKMNSGETTFLLEFPIWWAYAASFGASVVAALVALYCALARIAGLITGRNYMPAREGAAH